MVPLLGILRHEVVEHSDEATFPEEK